MCPVFPSDLSACGFDFWFCRSLPLKDQNPALIAGERDSLTYFLPAPSAKAVVFFCFPKYT